MSRRGYEGKRSRRLQGEAVECELELLPIDPAPSVLTTEEICYYTRISV